MAYRPKIKNSDGSLTDLPLEAETAVKLKTSRSIGLSGVTATAKFFDGTGAVTIPVTGVPTSLLTGTVPDSKIESVGVNKVTGLATVGKTGSYNDLTNKPTIPTITTKQIIDLIYPVGSIKITTTSTNPMVTLGGTWVAWGSGRVPVGVDTSQTNFNAAEKTGGEATHTLTVGEMPSHKHAYSMSFRGYSASLLQTDTEQGSPVKKYAAGNALTGVYPIQGASETGQLGQFAISTTGAGLAHNNLQPYITCYMWKRMA